MANIKFPDDTNAVTPQWWDLLPIADISDSNNLKEVTVTSIKDYTVNNITLDDIADWTTNKAFTVTEKTKLTWIEPWAEVNTINDIIAWTNVNINKTDPLNPIINVSDPVWMWDMLKSTYDPTWVKWDAFAMDNMVEWTAKKILTWAERTKIANSFDNLYWGCIEPATYTNNWNWTININSVDVNLFNNAIFNWVPSRYTLAGVNNIALTDKATNYIVWDYNWWSPIIRNTLDVTEITESNIIPILTIYRDWTIIHPQDWDSLWVWLSNKIHQSIVKTQRYRRESWLSLSEHWTRSLTLTAWVVWVWAVKVSLAEINTWTDSIYFYTHVAWVWTLSTSTQYNNTQYDDWTNVQSLWVWRYAVNWIYRWVENVKHLYAVLWTGNYTLAQAQASQPPAIPTAISSHWVLVAKIIVKNWVDTATSIESAFNVDFSMSSITSHGDLINLEVFAPWVTYWHINYDTQVATGTTDNDKLATKWYVDDNGWWPSLTEYDNWNSWATATINWNNWINQKITLTANCTLTLSNPVEWETYLLRIFQDWTGGRTPTFSPTIKPARTITTTASEYAIIGLYYVWWVYHSALLDNL